MSAKAILKSFVDDESGATAIEYALIAGIVSLAIITGLTGAKNELQTIFTSVAAGFQDALN